MNHFLYKDYDMKGKCSVKEIWKQETVVEYTGLFQLYENVTHHEFYFFKVIHFYIFYMVYQA